MRNVTLLEADGTRQSNVRRELILQSRRRGWARCFPQEIFDFTFGHSLVPRGLGSGKEAFGIGHAGAEKFQRAAHPVFHRAGGHPEHLGGLGDGQFLIVMQVEGLPRVLVQLLDQRVEPVGRVRFSGVFERRGRQRGAGCPPLVGLRAVRLPLPAPVHMDVMRYAVQPGREAGTGLVVGQGGPGLGEGPLRQVGGVLRMAGNAAQVGENGSVKALDQFRRCLPAARLRPLANLFDGIAHRSY